MATRSAWKIIFNDCVMPDIYFSYDDAKKQLEHLTNTTCAGFGRVVFYDNETGAVGN